MYQVLKEFKVFLKAYEVHMCVGHKIKCQDWRTSQLKAWVKDGLIGKV